MCLDFVIRICIIFNIYINIYKIGVFLCILGIIYIYKIRFKYRCFKIKLWKILF